MDIITGNVANNYPKGTNPAGMTLTVRLRRPTSDSPAADLFDRQCAVQHRDRRLRRRRQFGYRHRQLVVEQRDSAAEQRIERGRRNMAIVRGLPERRRSCELPWSWILHKLQNKVEFSSNAVRAVLLAAALARPGTARSVLFMIFAGVLFAVFLEALSRWCSSVTRLSYRWSFVVTVLLLAAGVGMAIACLERALPIRRFDCRKRCPLRSSNCERKSNKAIKANFGPNNWGKSANG